MTKNAHAEIEPGKCHCGCGGDAPIASQSNTRLRHKKGTPVRFIKGHHSRGSLSGKWKGGRIISTNGYVMILTPGHPRGDKQGYVPEQYLVVEKILGRILPLTVIVHHKNRKRADNRPENFVVCQDAAYHSLIHEREKAYLACGHAGWRQCKFCHKYDGSLTKEGIHSFHKECRNAYQNNRKRLLREGAWERTLTNR